MKVVSVINYKGGVGKTTMCANLGVGLAQKGKRVLLIDMDPQTNLTFSFYDPVEWENEIENEKTLKNFFKSKLDEKEFDFNTLILEPKKIGEYLKNSSGKIALISSHLELINIDLELAAELGGANIEQTMKKFLRIHTMLKKELQKIDGFDIVLIDCPPNFNIITKNSIVASNYILIPVKPDYLSTQGVDYLGSKIEELKSEYNQYQNKLDRDGREHCKINPEIVGIVFNMVQYYNEKPINAIDGYIQKVSRSHKVFESKIRENKSLFSEAPQSGLPVICGDYKNESHKRVIDELKSFIDEFEKRVGV